MTFAPTVELREGDDGKQMITGYALKFNERSQLLYGSFFEEIDARALDNTDMTDVLASLNHNFDKLLGRSTSGTLKLERDNNGLHYEIDPPDTMNGKEAMELISRGDIKGSSFIFELNDRGDKWDKTDDGIDVRTLIDIRKIHEVGPVINPAYLSTTTGVSKRSDEEEYIPSPPAPEPVTTINRNIAENEMELYKRKTL